MALILQAIVFFLVGFVSEAARKKSASNVKSVEEDRLMTSAETVFKISETGDDCSNQVALSGRHVNCTVIKRLGGGMQANTNIVSIDGLKYVMKETHDPLTVSNLQSEKRIIARLQDAGFSKMPQYYLDFQAKRPGSEVLVMEFLGGWFDLNSGAPPESAEIRDVRAAAFFLALDEMYKGKVSHCDLNPGNAMFNRNDPTQCKIIDFGMAEVNWGRPGTCNAMNAIPDLGYDGAAWKQIYAALGAPKGRDSIFSVCGSKCDTQTKFQTIVNQAKRVQSAFLVKYGQRQELPQNGVLEEPQAPSNGVSTRPQSPSASTAGMVIISSRELAADIRHGTVVEYEGVMGKANRPKISGQTITFNFDADNGPSQYGVRVYWASNKGKLKAKI